MMQNLDTSVMDSGEIDKNGRRFVSMAVSVWQPQEADNLRQDRRQEVKGRPLVFIAHSDGGIIVKIALNEAAKIRGDLANSCSGALFFETPYYTFVSVEERSRMISLVRNATGDSSKLEKRNILELMLWSIPVIPHARLSISVQRFESGIGRMARITGDFEHLVAQNEIRTISFLDEMTRAVGGTRSTMSTDVNLITDDEDVSRILNYMISDPDSAPYNQ
ncbi:hypothetical protein QBC38DRAFT_494644 [Podospora fimiseda]|uniref:Uncharacterized protein n=1 Tax=Podospora fimiseda TaxID=252190 RepID=A0AAN7H8N0_9PEZI|nr:hypothetical protein QBC38DRAFT_494644 [Podospora fimiseda]